MKMKILAFIVSLLVGSCAGIYTNTSAQNTGSQSSTAASAVTADTQKLTTCASAESAARTYGQGTSSAAAQNSSAAADCTQNSSCASAQTDCASSSKSSSCTGTQTKIQSRTQTQTCGSACSGTTDSSGCVINSESLDSLLNRLRTRQSCGTTSSQTSSASKPASSSSASTSSATANTGSSYASFQNEVVRLVNVERTSRGLKALTVDSALTKTATLKSEDMAKLNYFSHTSPTYGSPFDMMKQFGITYRAAGENIAMGQSTPAQVMQGWMNSEGHRANILNSSFTKIGVGIAKNSNGQYIWTQQFIG